MEAFVILAVLVSFIGLGILADRDMSKAIKGDPPPLEPIPMPQFRDIEEVAKDTPEYKAWKQKHDAKYSAQRSERNKWGTDFLNLKKELKAKHCKHVYNHGSEWQWYVCTECGYEDTPYYTWECDCEWEWERSYYSSRDSQILTRRNPLCRVHGRDIAKYQAQQFDYYKKQIFAEGGVIKKKEI